jgi:hypothetical protein
LIFKFTDLDPSVGLSTDKSTESSFAHSRKTNRHEEEFGDIHESRLIEIIGKSVFKRGRV